MHRQREHRRPRRQLAGHVAETAHVQTGDRVRFDGGERTRHQIDGDVGRERVADVHQRGHPRLFDEHELMTPLEPLVDRLEQMLGPRPH